jgi:hypothetical protein
MNAKRSGGLVFMLSLVLVGCETTTQVSQVKSDVGLLKRMNPAATVNGSDVKFSGLVKVHQLNDVVIPGKTLGSRAPQDKEIAMAKGPNQVKLEGSFNRDGQVFVFEADLAIEVAANCHYYPVAGLDSNSGKVWMWIQDDDNKVRVSDRVEGRFMRNFEPAKEDFVNLIDYSSIIDPDVMEDRRAVCDIPGVAGFRLDESFDRGDLSYRDRE